MAKRKKAAVRPAETDQPGLCLALRQELLRLQRELKSDPRFAKVERIEALLELYEAPAAEQHQIVAGEPAPAAKPAGPAIQLQNVAFDQSLEQPGKHEVTYEMRAGAGAWTAGKRVVSEDMALRIQDLVVASNFAEAARLLGTA